MTPLATFILAQFFGLGGGGLLSHTIVGVVSSALAIAGSYLTTRGQRATASDTWVREQFASFVRTQGEENAKLKAGNEALEKRIDDLELSARVKENELKACNATCSRLRRERDICRENHRALYDQNDQLRRQVALSVPIDRATATPPVPPQA